MGDLITLIEKLQGVSLVQFIVIAAIVLGGSALINKRLRRMVQHDNRTDLGLQKGETLDSKINGAMQQGISGAFGEVLAELRGMRSDVSLVKAELAGQRAAITSHGEEIKIILLQLGALTAQVGGMPAVQSLRARIENRRQEAAAAAAKAPEEIP